ncbi:protein translocase subunit SecD [Proteobacteria bacterium 005FR1]|nr:protein translocase subunit SecD [Proteobacteria bacterium 005FR1]
MLNRYPLWKNLLILFIAVLGLLYALPNVFPQDPAIQIASQESGQSVGQAALDKALKALQQAGIETVGSGLDDGTAMVRLAEADQQLAAKQTAEVALGGNYVVALNQVTTTPDWLAGIGGKPLKLGLDLAGGVHFLLEVDTEAAIEKRIETTASEVRRLLRADRIRYQSVEMTRGNEIIARFSTEQAREEAENVIRRELPDLQRVIPRNSAADSFVLRLGLSELTIQEIEDYAVSQNLTTLRNRVNEIGVSEPLVAQQGRNRIVVELPGVQDTTAAKRIIGRTANLEFRLEAEPGGLISNKEQFEYMDPEEQARRGSVWLEEDIIITGDSVANAQAGFDQRDSRPNVSITLDSTGGAKMSMATRNNVGRNMGTLFIETKTETSYRTNEQGERVPVTRQIVEKKVISLANILEPLGTRFQITGLDSPAYASELALLLRSGALAAPMTFVEEHTIGPSLGQENIDTGVRSIMLGLLLVVLFMLFYYRVFGIAANIALAMNIVLILAVMSILGATLTLPGMAGIVLTVGMAVDGNVLIFSRIREELGAGLSPQQAINSGFERATVSILDANLTTLIVAFILWGIGTGPVKGFAITLSIGILTSMFASIMGTRAIVNFMYGGRRVKKLWI